jgi:glycosyltransferase involved in cell wall biosynthesis
LQDPIEVIPHLIAKWQDGADMVLAKRTDRSTDGHLKRKTAEWFYKLHNKISNPQIEENVGDFRLMSRDVVENIKLMPERNLFMKGVLSWVGGRTDVVEYAAQNALPVIPSSMAGSYGTWLLKASPVSRPSRCACGRISAYSLPVCRSFMARG